MEYKNKYQNWLNDTNIDAETKEEILEELDAILREGLK